MILIKHSVKNQLYFLTLSELIHLNIRQKDFN